MKNFSVNKMITTVVLTLLAIGVGAWLLFWVIIPRIRNMDVFANIRGSTSVVDFHTHFGLDPDVPQLVLDGVRLRYESPPLVYFSGGEPVVYLRASFLRDFVDPFVFWDDGARVLFISTLYEMVELSPFLPRRDHVFVNGSPTPLERTVRYNYGDILVPQCIVESLYPLIIEFHAEYNMVVVISADVPQTMATVTSESANVRYWPSSHAPITSVQPQGAELLVFLAFDDLGESGNELGNFVRVRLDNGLLGYILIAEIGEVSTTTPLDNLNRQTLLGGFVNNNIHHPRTWQGGAGINLLWDMIYHPNANLVHMQTPLHSSVNVISPTWFRLDPAGTHFNSVASREYVDWAHEQGVSVWPLVFDVGYEESRLFLQDHRARQHGINQLIHYVEMLNLDGINIDFEHLRAPDGPYKIQFLRELAIPMRERGVVLSAAVKVPLPANAFYQRNLIGKTVDFVMVMTYDEFWASAPETGHGHGPNASLPFVRRGVENMLNLVPRERLIMSIPFYNRVWRESMATGEVRHHGAWGTNTTRDFFAERGVDWVWDAEIGKYFGEVIAIHEGETMRFRVWLEDARSVQEKMNVFYDNRLAGVSSWSRMFEIPEFWDVIGRYF
jgi:spore germination protein YaaH